MSTGHLQITQPFNTPAILQGCTSVVSSGAVALGVVLWRSLYAANNTIEGAHANPFVIWTGPGSGTAGADVMHITHNTFVNTIDNVRFVRDGNNAHFTNNLYVNSMSQGQTRNAGNTSIALNSPGGHGKMTTKYQWECADSTMLANGTCWDNNARNIHFENNAWFDTQELLDLMAGMVMMVGAGPFKAQTELTQQMPMVTLYNYVIQC